METQDQKSSRRTPRNKAELYLQLRERETELYAQNANLQSPIALQINSNGFQLH